MARARGTSSRRRNYACWILISMSTPAGISKCSRLSLSLCGERMTVNRCFSVGSGIGPRIVACVRRTVSTIFFVDWSMTSWSYAFRRMRIFCLSATLTLACQRTDRPEADAQRYRSGLRFASWGSAVDRSVERIAHLVHALGPEGGDVLGQVDRTDLTEVVGPMHSQHAAGSTT